MLSFYLSGVIVAFFISIVSLFISFEASQSQTSRNLRKIGQYYSFRSSTYTENKPNSETIIILGRAFADPWLSWAYVLYAAAKYLSWSSHKASLPENLKEIQFKLANMDLSKDQLLQMFEEISQFLDKRPLEQASAARGPVIPPAADTGSFETKESGSLKSMEPDVLERELWQAKIWPEKKIFECRRWDEGSFASYTYTSKFQNRLEGEKVGVRLLEECEDEFPANTISWSVKDGVVLEQEVRAQYARLKSMLDDELARLRSEVEWHELESQSYEIRYFILSHHPEVLDELQYRHLIRADLEKLTSAREKTLAKAAELDLAQSQTEKGIVLTVPEGLPEMQVQAVYKALYEEFSEAYQVPPSKVRDLTPTKSGITYLTRHEDALRELLGEKKAA